MLASLFVSTQTTVTTVAPSSSKLFATANYAPIPSTPTSVDDELRVISTRLVSEEQGLVVYGNTRLTDSMLVSARFIAELHPGDIISDSEGTIDR
jgi:hypothetical protein